MKKAALGALGTSALVAGLGTTEKALARLFSRQSAAHVDEFLKRVSTGKTSAEIDSNFLKTFNSLMDIAARDERVQAGIDTIGDYVAQQVGETKGESVPPFGLTQSVMDALAGGYLAASRGFENEAIPGESLAKYVANPEEVLSRVEPDFVTRLIPNLQEAMRGDAELEKLVGTGNEHLQQVFRQIEQDPARAIICRINGKQVPCWLWGVVVVIVIVIVIVLK
ncbi:MAG TPA: hypothetical protein VGB68_19740 [Pyrinomonadaceae bacterium]